MDLNRDKWTAADDFRRLFEEQKMKTAAMGPDEFRANAKTHSRWMSWAWLASCFAVLGFGGWRRFFLFLSVSTFGFLGGVWGVIGHKKCTWDQNAE